MEILAASVLIPMEGPPVDGGALAVRGGTIAAVGPLGDLRRHLPGTPVRHLEGCALLPPLVNAHTHLELTGLASAPRARAMVPWILEVVALKRSAPEDAWARAVGSGLGACRSTGQGWVADVVSQPGAAGGYPEGAGAVRAFPEVIAAGEARVGEAVAAAVALAGRLGPHLGGISPHAPYTTCAGAYTAAQGWAERRGLPLMTHVAESPEEIEFCETGGGPVADLLYRSLGIPPPRPPGIHPVDWLARIGILGPGTILVHAVHLGHGHPALLARTGTGVVLCPRSNRRLSGGTAPGGELLRAGVRVGLGTDSVLSAGSLDLWQDVRAAVEDYGWSPAQALRAATRGGAEVLGLGAVTGRFAPGLRADILAVPLGSGSGPWERVLDGGRAARLWLGGRTEPQAAPESLRPSR